MLPDTSQHGWKSSFEIKLIESAFKEDIDKLLVDAEDDVSFEDGEESDEIVTRSIMYALLFIIT